MQIEPGLSGYSIVRRLGAGSMSIVYEAEQKTSQRRVALKILGSGLMQPEAIRGFAQRVAAPLGRLDHPSIARLVEADTFDVGQGDQPYFATEYVEGVRITDHVADRRPGMRERLLLFASVCDAVQHAHEQGVVHLDLRPDNVLVTRDGRPVLLDFGVLSCVDRDRLDALTAARDPAGMCSVSPEQLPGSSLSADARSDVYALGSLLYELLSGRRALVLEGRSASDAAAIISAQDPPLLGRRDPSLRGDLETICSVALAKQPTRRYVSAVALAGDVRRFLADEPLSVQAPDRSHTLVKFARRHRPVTLVAGAVAATLVVALVVALVWAGRASSAEQLALEEARAAEAARDFLADVVMSGSPEEWGGEEPTVRAALVAAVDRLERYTPGDPRDEADIRYMLGEVFTRLGDVDQAGRNLERSLALRRAALGESAPEVASSLNALGQVAQRQGRLIEAEELCRRGLSLRRSHGAQDKGLASSLDTLAGVLFAREQLAEAQALLEESLAIRRRVQGGDHGDVASTLGQLAAVHQAQGHFDEAEELFHEAVAIWRRSEDPTNPLLASALEQLAGFELRVNGDPERARALAEEALALRTERQGAGHPALAECYELLGRAAVLSGAYQAAEASLRQAVAIRRNLGDGAHPLLSNSLREFGALLHHLGRLEEARQAYEEAGVIARARLGREHRNTLATEAILGRLLVELDELEEAAAHLDAAFEGMAPFESAWTHRHLPALWDDALACRLVQRRWNDAAALLDFILQIGPSVTVISDRQIERYRVARKQIVPLAGKGLAGGG